MFPQLINAKIAIVGGGRFCKAFLDAVYNPYLDHLRPEIAGIAELDDQAAGVVYARKKSIHTTRDYTDLFLIDDLDAIIELTNDHHLAQVIKDTLPERIHFYDHFEARSIIDFFRMEAKKTEILEKIRDDTGSFEKIEGLFTEFFNFALKITGNRSKYTHKIRETLVSGEKAMSQIVEGSTIPTFVIDKDHVITHWNQALENLSGFLTRQMVGTRDQAIPFYKKKRPTMADVLLDHTDEKELEKLYGKKWKKSELVEGGYEAKSFLPELGKNGKWVWFTAAPITAPDGTITGAIETLWDRTEHFKAEEEKKQHIKDLDEREKSLAQIIQGSTIPTFVIDKDHVITHWNQALEKLSGFLTQQMVGTRDQAIPFYKEKRPTMADVLLDQPDETELEKLYGKKWKKSELVEGGYEAEFFLPELGKNGKWLWFTATPITAPDGTITGAIETLWDRTEHWQAEEEKKQHIKDLDEREKNLHQIIQGSTIPTFVIDKNHTIVHWNRALEKLSGYTNKQMVGTDNQGVPFYGEKRKSMADVLMDQLDEKEIGKLYGDNWQKSLLIKGGYDAEKFFPNLGETGKWVWFTAAPITAPDGTITGAIETLWDRTEEKRLQKELVQSERLAAIGQTVAGMAHCIKNILHGFKGGSYLVDMGINKNKTEKLTQGWDMIQRNIGRTSDLVLDLLSYSKERAPEYARCLPNEIANDVCELMKDNAEKSGIELITDFSLDIKDVSMDGRTIYRCLLNLVSNAIDACIFDENQDKQHQVRVKTILRPNDCICFEVKDNGSGMSNDVKKKLFTSFFSTKGPKGTGLGLLVTCKLIEEHMGAIKVSSKEGEGTCFTLKLPYEILEESKDP